MLTDARTLDHDAVLTADVAIVGAGPAGITLALELAGSGLEILVLEAGAVSPAATDRWAARGENADPSYYRLGRTRVVGFGGSSNHWMPPAGMRARPLDELDFSERPEVDRPGWPLALTDLEGPYRRAQQLCRLGPFDYDLPSVEKARGPRLPLEAHGLETVMFRTAQLGNFPGRLGEVVSADGVHLLVHATVVGLIPDPRRDRIMRLEVATDDRRRLAIAPGTVILACGGIENARMLLAHRRQHGGWLPDVGDQMGRGLMEHPHVRTGAVIPNETDALERMGLYELPATAGESSFGMVKLHDATLRSEELLACAWAMSPVPATTVSPSGRALTALRETVLDFRRPVPDTGRRLRAVAARPTETARTLAHRRHTHDRPRVLGLSAMSEQAPDPNSRVLLSPRRDRLGRTRARVDWRLGELDLRSIRRSQRLLGDAMEAAGIGRLVQPLGQEEPPALIGGGFHHMGTTRMSVEPTDGVVDPTCRVHGVDNCYVAGMSLFPTAGYANPTLTVVALAVRLADHLRQRLAPG